jgi:hypothetical protein
MVLIHVDDCKPLYHKTKVLLISPVLPFDYSQTFARRKDLLKPGEAQGSNVTRDLAIQSTRPSC